MDPQIANLLEIAPYDASSGAKLEAHVTTQLAQKTYDFAANKALLKNYQINSENMKIEFVSSVLILSLMRLPSTDFLALTYLIPTKVVSHESVTRIKKCADALERGKFHQFWEEYVGSQAIFAQANGFVDSIRLFILSNLRDTFKTMPKNLFQQQLGLNDSSVVSFCESNKLVEKIAGEDIVFASNDENQKKTQLDENVRIEEVCRH